MYRYFPPTEAREALKSARLVKSLKVKRENVSSLSPEVQHQVGKRRFCKHCSRLFRPLRGLHANLCSLRCCRALWWHSTWWRVWSLALKRSQRRDRGCPSETEAFWPPVDRRVHPQNCLIWIPQCDSWICNTIFVSFRIRNGKIVKFSFNPCREPTTVTCVVESHLYRMSLNISQQGLRSMIWARTRDILWQRMSAWGLLVACKRKRSSTVARTQKKLCSLGNVQRRDYSLYLGNGQHPFGHLSIASHRKNPEITAKEPKEQNPCKWQIHKQHLTGIARVTPALIYLCWMSDKISSSFLPLKGAYKSMKLFRCTCTNLSILSKSPDSWRRPGTSSGSTSRKAVPGTGIVISCQGLYCH